MKKQERKSDDDILTMWTVQTQQVLGTIENNGIYHVKNKYIQEKYGETAWVFQEAYQFFVRKASLMLHRPDQAESPVWMFRNRKWAVPQEGTYLLKLKIPANQVILFDLRIWSKILNLDYIGTTKEVNGFYEQTKRQGISDSLDVFRTAFYPLQKKQILKSWDMLFESGNVEQEYQQGAAWELRKEWIDKVL